VVADELMRTGSLPAAQRLIVTSLLYGAARAGPAGGGLPPWAAAPLKILAAEPWLDSAGLVTAGGALGVCDFRFLGGGESGYRIDARLLWRIPSALGDAFGEESYLTAALSLGGCNADAPRPRSSSVGLMFAQHRLAKTLCALGDAVLPEGFDTADASDPALERAAGHLVRRAFGRAPAAGEAELLRGEMRACLDAAEAGCAGPEEATRWLCVRLLDSAEFGFY
jgi:hypothetical protein